MSIIAQERHSLFRIEQLLEPGMPEKCVEVIEGELVVLTPAGWQHNKIGYQIARIFEDFCQARPHLVFAADNNLFVLQRNPDVLLGPDASLGRLAKWRTLMNSNSDSNPRHAANGAKIPDRAQLRWRLSLEDYQGQWVALSEDRSRVIAHATDLIRLDRAVVEAGESPDATIFHRVALKNTLFLGGQ